MIILFLFSTLRSSLILIIIYLIFIFQVGSFDFFLLLCIICTFKWICQICLCNFRSSKHTFKCLFVWFVAVPLDYPYVPSSGFVLFLAVPYLQVSLPLICWWSFRLSIRTSKCSMGLSICTFKCFFFWYVVLPWASLYLQVCKFDLLLFLTLFFRESFFDKLLLLQIFSRLLELLLSYDGFVW